MLPEGTYRARAVPGSATLCTTSTGKEQVAVQFRVIDEAYDDQTITWFGFFTEKTEAHTIRALRACGWEGADLSNLAGVENNEVDIVVEHSEWEGKVSAKVRFVNEPGAAPNVKPMGEAERLRFAARMRARIASMGNGKASKPAPRKVEQPEDTPPVDDPFA